MTRLKIKEVAVAKGMSQRRLSRLTGIDIKGIQRVFRFPYSNVTTFTLDKFAKALEVDASALIETVPNEDI